MTHAAILIVEDEAIVAMDLRAELESHGYIVAGVAAAGEQALQIARDTRPDLALMDIRLQGAMDGIDVAERLGRELSIPVVFLTSHSDPATVERAAHAAPYGYLTKPFRSKELRVAIEMALFKSRLERQLRESERWFASTLHCVHDGVVATESDGRVRFMNPVAESLTGWTMAEAVGHDVSDVLRFGPEGAADTVPQRALSEGRVIGIEHARALRRRDGVQVPVDESAAPVDGDAGRCLGVVVVLRDARERLAQEQRLRASEARFHSAFDVAPFGMALVSLDGRFIQVNGALCRLLGTDAAALVDAPQSRVSEPQDLAHEQECLRQLLGERLPVVQFPKRYLSVQGGGPVWTLVTASALREGDAVVCLLYQVHDLTQQRHSAEQLASLAAERLKLSETEARMRAKDQFLSWISHELRTPLNAVIGFAELLKARGGDADTMAQFTDHILHAGMHLSMLIDDVTDLQRAATGQLKLDMAAVPVDDAVERTEELLEPLAAEFDVHFERDISPGLRVRADALRLRQVLLNLGSNAVKYSGPGGKVVWRGHAEPDGRVLLSVEDEGAGMPAEALQRLFKPFERLGKENSGIPGTGLGLLVSRRLVEAMGGQLDVASEVGRGTRVEVRLAGVKA